MKSSKVLDLRINHNKKKSNEKLKKIIFFGFFIIVIFVIIFFSIFYYSSSSLKKNNEKINLNDQKEAQILLEKVSELIELPKGEIPTVATVLDKEKIRDYPFFDNSQNGDKLLIYSKSMKVILYRPKTNKIVGIAPLYVDKEKEN